MTDRNSRDRTERERVVVPPSCLAACTAHNGATGVIQWLSRADDEDPELDHYDAFGRPIVYEYKKTGGVHEALLEYKYDYASNITWRYDDKMEGLGTPVY